MAVINMMVGAPTVNGCTFAVKVDTGPVSIRIADNPGMDGYSTFGPASIDANGVAKITVDSLQANSRYYWMAEDNGVVGGQPGQFRTLPTGIASFKFGASSCAGNRGEGVGDVLEASRLSNHEVFNAIEQKAIADDWVFFAHTGDMHYYDLGSGLVAGGASLDNYRRAYDDVLLQPNQAGLYRNVPLVYMYDDHDYGPNDSDGTHTGRSNILQTYRERIPHYPLGDETADTATYQSFEVGRVLFILSDERADRSPNSDPDDSSKTMLGANQKAWMANILDNSDAELLIWLSPEAAWHIPSAGDSWSLFNTERLELVDMFSDWLDRMIVVNGDAHHLGVNFGGHPYGGMPVIQLSSLDSNPSGAGAHWDIGYGSANNYGWFEVVDSGREITVTVHLVSNTNVEETTFTFGTPREPVILPGLERTLRGSFESVTEARLCPAGQIGPDPHGINIPVIDGNVKMQADTPIYASVDLTTSMEWPKRVSDPLAPYGKYELFVRRGIVLGDEVMWFPLGYFDLESIEEQDDQLISIVGYDRMRKVQRDLLLKPKTIKSSSTLDAFVREMTSALKNPIIAYDDDIGSSTFGRKFVVERERDTGLINVVNNLGKIVYFDGNGILRIMDRPEGEIYWRITAEDVLLDTGRRISREGGFNAVAVTGEGHDQIQPVWAAAYDNNASSPTYFHGDYGRVPRFFNSPILTNNVMAAKAARTELLKTLGLPYSMDFVSILNPDLRPYDRVRITNSLYDVEDHTIESVIIPLVDGQISAATREQTLLNIGIIGG